MKIDYTDVGAVQSILGGVEACIKLFKKRNCFSRN